MSYQKIAFAREKYPDYWLYQFNDLTIKTDPYVKQDPNRVLCLGWGCGIQMNYMARNPEMVRDKRVFEPFAGSGPMGFLALKLGAEHVDLLDINPRAVAFQRENARLNQFLQSKFTLYEGDIASFQVPQRYDVLFANPPFIPIPKGISGTLHSDGGIDGNDLIDVLLARIGGLLKPEGEAMFYAFQIENQDGPLLLQGIAKHLQSRSVELTKGWETSVPFEDFLSAYIEAFPESESLIHIWAAHLKDTYGDSLSLNDYVVHVGPQSEKGASHTIRTYDGTKYAKGYYPPSEPMSMRSRVFENRIVSPPQR